MMYMIHIRKAAIYNGRERFLFSIRLVITFDDDIFVRLPIAFINF